MLAIAVYAARTAGRTWLRSRGARVVVCPETRQTAAVELDAGAAAHDLAPEDMPAALETHRPICWNCHIAASFRRSFSDRVVDRNR